jgi:hypothetical protein
MSNDLVGHYWQPTIDTNVHKLFGGEERGH